MNWQLIFLLALAVGSSQGREPQKEQNSCGGYHLCVPGHETRVPEHRVRP